MSHIDGPHPVAPQVERARLRRGLRSGLVSTAIVAGAVGIFLSAIQVTAALSSQRAATTDTAPPGRVPDPPLPPLPPPPNALELGFRTMGTTCRDAAGNDYQGVAILGDGPCVVVFQYDFAPRPPQCAAAVRRIDERISATLPDQDRISHVPIYIEPSRHGFTLAGGSPGEVAYWTCVGMP